MSVYNREAISKDLRHFIYYRDNGECAHCGRIVSKKHMHVDHVIPVCGGGTNNRCNLVVSCAKCNLSKGGSKLDGDEAMRIHLGAALRELYGPTAKLDDPHVVQYYLDPIKRAISVSYYDYSWMEAIEMAIDVSTCPMGKVDMLYGLTSYIDARNAKDDDYE